MLELPAEQFKSLMRFTAKMTLSCFNKVMLIRLENLRPISLKRDDYATVTIKPSHSDIFVPEFAQQLLEAQKEARVFQAITKQPKAFNKDSQGRGRGKRGGKSFRGKFFKRGQGRGQGAFQPHFQPQFAQQWGTPPANNFGQSQPNFNPFSYQGAQQGPSQPSQNPGRGRGRGKPRGA